MSQAEAAKNISNMKDWVASAKSNDWQAFKEGRYYHYRGVLSKSKVAVAANVGLKALKTDNPEVIAIYDEFAIEVQKKFKNVFKPIISSLERYHSYIEEMRLEGNKFPANESGELDYYKIAKQCGVTVKALTSVSIAPCLEEDVLSVGTEVHKGSSIEERMEERNTVTSAALSKIRKDLSVAQETINGLQKQLLMLEKENRQLKCKSVEERESLEQMLETGRRFTL
ncbi:MAG: hypothetical protein CML20_06885 [Rheinheimera sp.]|nr:hypothetical protein [Rheinheimera sp.]|tara:strand:+ start:5707 stop:6384 length:678 start_codon:yes stop_codon:yes gene_type:complete